MVYVAERSSSGVRDLSRERRQAGLSVPAHAGILKPEQHVLTKKHDIRYFLYYSYYIITYSSSILVWFSCLPAAYGILVGARSAHDSGREIGGEMLRWRTFFVVEPVFFTTCRRHGKLFLCRTFFRRGRKKLCGS